MAAVHPISIVSPTKTNGDLPLAVVVLPSSLTTQGEHHHQWIPSFRMLTAGLLCMCFASVHMMNSNMGMAIVCMVNSTEYDDSPAPRHHRASNFTDFDYDANFTAEPISLGAPRLNWSPTDQGYIFGAFNAGLLFMLLTGLLADKFNAKYMIIASVLTASAANFIIPLLSPKSESELKFITLSNAAENVGKKRNERKVPWHHILRSGPVWAALISVVCHEFPLMTMIMFLPSYLHDVHKYDPAENGILSALPTLCLWISKIGSSYLNTWLQRKTKLSKCFLSKLLNAIGSVGLGIFLIGATFLDSTRASLAVIFLCQAALVAIAPAFSGAITGLTFFFVAICGISNPLLTKWIVQTGSQLEWNIVFYISTIISFLPVIIFSIWGSADVQWWAKSVEHLNEAQQAKHVKHSIYQEQCAAKKNSKKMPKDAVSTSSSVETVSEDVEQTPRTSIENIQTIA
uniref:Uncharacterized protein n=1 Tax=Panagrolaimus sp. ES5 TaxID=591445 RepID=A0AC34FA75_9BILA